MSDIINALHTLRPWLSKEDTSSEDSTIRDAVCHVILELDRKQAEVEALRAECQEWNNELETRLKTETYHATAEVRSLKAEVADLKARLSVEHVIREDLYTWLWLDNL
jgi:hypothetical protein